MILYPHLSVNEKGHLTIGGVDTVDIAEKFGTPAYVLDENVIRKNMREYKCAAEKHFGEGALPLFASKALCFVEIYKICAEEGLGIDCVSGGELYTAKAADFPAERIYFHGNNKTQRDICDAMDMGVGHFVVDNIYELYAVNAEAEKRGLTQDILLRITPGIDPHTHKAVVTGSIDSKFGSAIETGQAMEIVKLALSLGNVHLDGLHCHIGSQIFDIEPFASAAGIMAKFIADIKAECNFEINQLNLGGGIGVKYLDTQPDVDVSEAICQIAQIVKEQCQAFCIKTPEVRLEPGRSIVANAGITLYTVGGIKEIPGFLNYISVDGGMPDNPRYALYQSPYTFIIANRADKPRDYTATIAGRCCESGDLLGERVSIQSAKVGDILATLTTGAYNYSMSSNYNRLPRPPVIFVRDGVPRVVVRRETYEDIIKNDVF